LVQKRRNPPSHFNASYTKHENMSEDLLCHPVSLTGSATQFPTGTSMGFASPREGPVALCLSSPLTDSSWRAATPYGGLRAGVGEISLALRQVITCFYSTCIASKLLGFWVLFFFVLSQPWPAAEEEVRASHGGHRTHRTFSDAEQHPVQTYFETLITLSVCSVLQFLPLYRQ